MFCANPELKLRATPNTTPKTTPRARAASQAKAQGTPVPALDFSPGTAGFSPWKNANRNKRALALVGSFFKVYGCIPIQSIWLVVTAPAPPASPFCSVIAKVLAV